MDRDDFISRGRSDVDYIVKTPGEVLDYTLPWAVWLADAGSDTIASSSWSVPAGVTQNNATHTATTTTIWLSGGTAGATYRIVNTVVTAGGRTAQRAFDLVVVAHR